MSSVVGWSYLSTRRQFHLSFRKASEFVLPKQAALAVRESRTEGLLGGLFSRVEQTFDEFSFY